MLRARIESIILFAGPRATALAPHICMDEACVYPVVPPMTGSFRGIAFDGSDASSRTLTAQVRASDG